MKPEKQPDKTVVQAVLSFTQKVLRWHGHAVVYAALFALLVFSIIVLALRYWLLPDIAQYREDIAASISQAAGQRVAIGKIEAGWEGLRPRFVLQDVQVYDQQGRSALYLSQIENTLSWWTLFLGEARFHSMIIDQPNLVVRRQADGLIFVAGIAVNQPGKESGFVDWVLKQDEIRVRDAVILWQDNQRQAPPLVLSKVGLHLENQGRKHLFGVRATPSSLLATPLDLRGELHGKTMRNLSAWYGTVYARLDYADMEAWRKWVTYPLALQKGSGAVQVWMGFDKKRVNELTGDVRLHDVKMRLAENLPELDLKALTGRMRWKEVENGQEIQGEKLSIVTQEGWAVGPSSFTARFIAASGSRLAEAEVDVDHFDLTPLLALSKYLPLDPSTGRELDKMSPRGTFRDLTLKWTGDWHAPKKYTAKTKFVNFGINPYQKLPGLFGVSGNLDVDEDGGVLSLNSPGAQVELQKVFREPLPFDSLTAQAKWKIKKGQLDLKLTNVSFSNAHLAGSLYGSYQTLSGSPGRIDLTGSLTRADARFVGRYIPLVVGQNARDWLDKAFLAGSSNDVHLRLKGNLADFPFVDRKTGIFKVTAKVTGGALDYVDGWPKIENIEGDLLFEGKRMEVNTSKARIFGVALKKVQTQIPDLLVFDETLVIDGEAQGPTNDFLRYVNQSPVAEMIDRFTDGAQATGDGKLALKLRIPLRHSKDSKIGGDFQFLNNRIVFGKDIPPLDKVNGKLAFTESSIKTQNLNAQFLGGPLVMQADTRPDSGIRITAQGKINGAVLRDTFTSPLARYLKGITDWRGLVTMRNQQTDIVIDSTLQGLVSELPAPLAKPGVKAIPLHFERKFTGPQQDIVSLSYGKILTAKLLRKAEGDKIRIDRGVLSFGGAEAKPEASGVWVSGTLPYLNLDQWRAILSQNSAQDGMTPMIELSGLNLSFTVLDAFGRRFSDLHLNARDADDGWQADLNSKELNGNINWNPKGRGKVVARLKNLTIPNEAPPTPEVNIAATQTRELPALDIVADNLEIKQRNLGRLEVLAIQQGADWKIEKLKLANPDMALQMDGLWQAWLVRPQTKANLKLDVKDVGKFLARFGYPDSVKRGTAKLEGQLSWAGGPSEIDYPSLTGDLTLTASNGQFLKIEPGIGKLLGILSLQALPRRITLDFRDIFSEGFAFNAISGSMRIDRGMLYSNDFLIVGPAAVVGMSGETDIAKETQKLRVKVTPVVGEGVSVAGAFLGGPVVGLASLLLQKLLKDPLGQLVSYEYNITGTWTDPKVTKVSKEGATSSAE